MQDDADIGAIEVRHHVGAHGVDRVRSLQPDIARDAAEVPPVDQSPRDDVVAAAPGRIDHPDGEGVLRARDGIGVERERRVATLVVAEVAAVQPDVGDIVDRSELEGHRSTGPLGGHGEPATQPGVVLDPVGGRVEGPRDRHRRPCAVVVGRVYPSGRLGLDGRQRPTAVGERQVHVEVTTRDPPRASQLNRGTWLPLERRHRNPVLHRDGASGRRLERQGWSKVGVRWPVRAATCGEENGDDRQGDARAGALDGGLHDADMFVHPVGSC